MSELETIANEAFAQFNCPGGAVCKGRRSPYYYVDGVPTDSPCLNCKAPPHVYHKGVKVYRSYYDYCSD